MYLMIEYLFKYPQILKSKLSSFLLGIPQRPLKVILYPQHIGTQVRVTWVAYCLKIIHKL